jgi:hypothetical protein
LAEKVTDGGPGAVEAALELLERREPATFLEAIKLLCGDRPCTDAAFDAIADAWGTYHVVRDMPGADDGGVCFSAPRTRLAPPWGQMMEPRYEILRARYVSGMISTRSAQTFHAWSGATSSPRPRATSA